MVAYNTWGVSWGTSWGVSWGTGNPPPPAAATGGHYLPPHGKHKRAFSNILIIYNQAKELPRKETKELRDAISEFVEPQIAAKPYVPDILEIDYEALSANDEAYERFSRALADIQQKLKISLQQEEDEELLLLAIMACDIN